jgi:hypothetical protein
MTEREIKIITAIILAKIELQAIKNPLGIATLAMSASTVSQYLAHIKLMSQSGATFIDVLKMLTEGDLK